MPGHISGTLTFPVTCSVHRTFPSSNLLSFCLCYQSPSPFLYVWCKAVCSSAGTFCRTQGKRQLMYSRWLLYYIWWSFNRHVWSAVHLCCTWPCTIVQHDAWWQIASMIYRVALHSECGFSERNIEFSSGQEQKYSCCMGLHGFSQGQFMTWNVCSCMAPHRGWLYFRFPYFSVTSCAVPNCLHWASECNQCCVFRRAVLWWFELWHVAALGWVSA